MVLSTKFRNARATEEWVIGTRSFEGVEFLDEFRRGGCPLLQHPLYGVISLVVAICVWWFRSRLPPTVKTTTIIAILSGINWLHFSVSFITIRHMICQFSFINIPHDGYAGKAIITRLPQWQGNIHGSYRQITHTKPLGIHAITITTKIVKRRVMLCLTHQSQMTHMCISKLVIIDSKWRLSPFQRRTIVSISKLHCQMVHQGHT